MIFSAKQLHTTYFFRIRWFGI